jgi:hypothetical protein
MWHPLSSLFNHPQQAGWSEVDIKYVVQEYLQHELHADGVYCESVKDGRAVVRVSAPALAQQVRLLLFDVQRAVRERTGYSLRSLDVRR